MEVAMTATRSDMPVQLRSAGRKARRVASYSLRKLRAIRFEALSLLRPQVIRSPYGVTLAANWGDATFRLYAIGGYGKFLSNFLRGQSAPFVFLDIGANQGLYSMIASRNPNCTGVVAFEPVDGIADLMEQNLRLNIVRKVNLVRRAVSDQVETLQIPFDPGHSGASTLTGRRPSFQAGPTVSIQTIDHGGLSRIVHEGDEPIIVKVDVEGHEPVAIAELLKTSFAPRIRAIFYECDENWISASEMRRLLERHGFDSFEQVGSGSHYDVLATRSARVETAVDQPVSARSA
jgi:FkbM family methyltransferase